MIQTADVVRLPLRSRCAVRGDASLPQFAGDNSERSRVGQVCELRQHVVLDEGQQFVDALCRQTDSVGGGVHGRQFFGDQAAVGKSHHQAGSDDEFALLDLCKRGCQIAARVVVE